MPRIDAHRTTTRTTGVSNDTPVIAPTTETPELDQMEPKPHAAMGYTAQFDNGAKRPQAVVDGGYAVDLAKPDNGRDPTFLAEAGKPLTVVAPASMFSSPKTKKVTLVWRIAGTDVEGRVAMADGSRDARTGALSFVPAKFDIPDDAKGIVRLSFEVEDSDGRTSTRWDPTYDARLVPKGGATIAFNDDWSVDVAGSLRASGAVRIAYDIDRMRAIVPDASKVTACFSFDGKKPIEMPLTVEGNGQTFLPALRVPDGAQKLSLWFRAEKEGAEAGYDSRFGKNYEFAVETAEPDADPEWRRQVTNMASQKINGVPKFPKLLDPAAFAPVGPADGGTNCIAWSLGKRDEWVWPGTTIASFDKLYADQGYVPLETLDVTNDPNIERIALYGVKRPSLPTNPPIEVTHAARQEKGGTWLSKLGTEPLIRHTDVDAVTGPSYGELVRVYVRPRTL